MKFSISPLIFEKVPNLCIGTVVATCINNEEDAAINQLLAEEAGAAARRFTGVKVKEDAAILPYREAFLALGFNPNKYMCSVEALFTRIAKGGEMPSINPLVNLNNAISLKYTLPMGSHALTTGEEDINLRYSAQGDYFIPFGSEEKEELPQGEAVYAVGSSVRTRRWAWRQSEEGKVTTATTAAFFPIDGFIGINDTAVKAATEELAFLLQKHFKAGVKTAFLCQSQSEISFNL